VKLLDEELKVLRHLGVDRQPVVCPWFRIGDHVVRTIGMAVRFDPVVDVTLDELRVELIYPYDDAADRILRQMSGVQSASASRV
jgi:hypothetical protein